MKITDARFDELTDKARNAAIQAPPESFSVVYAETLRHLVNNEYADSIYCNHAAMQEASVGDSPAGV